MAARRAAAAARKEKQAQQQAQTQIQEQSVEEWDRSEDEFKIRQAQDIAQNLDMLVEMQGDINSMINGQSDGITAIDNNIAKSDALLLEGLKEVCVWLLCTPSPR